MVYTDYLIVGVLLTLSGLFSGLTLGLMSLNPFDLKRKVKLKYPFAKKIYPLRKRGNLLLCTLLLGNVGVNSVLAVFLGSITSGVIAAIVATGLIVIIGEILPQAVFSRYAMILGARASWLVYLFLIILYPVTKPLSMILDKSLGGELPTIFSKKEFRYILEEHKSYEKSDLAKHEFKILEGGLVFSEKVVKDVMTPKSNVFSIEQNTILNKENLKKIHASGHSRIPVYSKTMDKIVGRLYVKDLIIIKPESKKLVKSIMRKNVYYVDVTDNLDKVFALFKNRRVHLMVVIDEFKNILGIITLEDVLEEIVGEIIDEHDQYIDMRSLK